MERNNRDIFIGVFIGMVIGAVSALLLAPGSGKETRQKIKEQFGATKDKVSATAQQAMERGKEVTSKVVSRAEEVREQVK